MNAEGFEFNKVTFGLPVESYRVAAFVTTDERLPVVTEYVLRLLRICDSTTPAALRTFFGFSDAEALAVVESLTRQGLIISSDDELSLSPYASERFDVSSNDDYPRFTKVEPRVEMVAFDLLSFSPLRSRSIGTLTPNSYRLDAPVEALSNSVDRAEKAYFTHFSEITRLQGDRHRENLTVYSVEDVISKRRGYLPVPVSFALGEQGQVTRSAPTTFEEEAAPELVNSFHERVSSVIPTALSVGNSHIERFIETFELDWMTQYWAGKKFDLYRFAEDLAMGKLTASTGVQPLFGNLYLSKNLELLTRHITSSKSDPRLRLCNSAAWVGPDHFLWGRGEAFSQALGSVRSSLEGESGNTPSKGGRKKGDEGRWRGDDPRSSSVDELNMFWSTEPGQEQVVASQLFGLESARHHGYRPAATGDVTLGGRLELFLHPASFAVALFHLSLPGHSGLWAPVGFISSRVAHVAQIHKLLVEVVGERSYTGRLVNSVQQHTEQHNFASACGFLQYSDFHQGKAPN